MPTERSVPDACPGIVAVHQADDGGLVRIRLPGGLLTCAQLTSLAEASAEFGDGNLDLTSRANLQIRGLRASTAESLSQRLYAAGLLPSIRHDRVRNIVASPLSGLDEHSSYDVLPLARELDRRLCGSDRLAELPGRFLFTLDDGRGDVSALASDVGLQIVDPRSAALLLAGADTGIRVNPDTAVDVLIAAAEAFLTERAMDNPTAWRLTELPSAITRIVPHLPTLPPPRDSPVRSSNPASPSDLATGSSPGLATDGPPRVGLHTFADGRSVIVIAVPLGRLTNVQAERVAQVVGAGGEVRITPWRSVVVPIADAANPPSRDDRSSAPAHLVGSHLKWGVLARQAARQAPTSGENPQHTQPGKPADGTPSGPREGSDRGENGRRAPGGDGGPVREAGRGEGSRVEETRGGPDRGGERREVRGDDGWSGGEGRGGDAGTGREGRGRDGGTGREGRGRDGETGVGEMVGWLVESGLVVDPGSAWVGVTACTGRPGCGKALADVRADAVRVLTLTGSRRMVHWSGCDRRCGQPKGDLVDVVATSNGYQVDGVQTRNVDEVAAAIATEAEAEHQDVTSVAVNKQVGEGDR